MITAYVDSNREVLFREFNKLYRNTNKIVVGNAELRMTPFYNSGYGRKDILKINITFNGSNDFDDPQNDAFGNALGRFFAEVSFDGYTTEDKGGWGEVYTRYSVGYPVIQVDTVYNPEFHEFKTTNNSKQWEDKNTLWHLLSMHDYAVCEQEFNSIVKSYINSNMCSEELLALRMSQPRNEIKYEIFYHDRGYEFFRDYVYLDDSAYSEKYDGIERDQLMLLKLRKLAECEHDEQNAHCSDESQYIDEVSDEPQE